MPKSNKISVSVVILTQNNQDIIEKCLESIKWASEIIIIDDYSKDKTLKICKKYTKNIFKRKLDGFASQRNFGSKKAKNNWILNIDSDENVSINLCDAIGNKIKKTDFYGYYIPFKNYLGKKWLRFGGLYPDYHLRLFRKDKASFRKSIHEEVKIYNSKVGYIKNGYITHCTYKDYGDFWNKVKNYSQKESEMEYKQKIKWFYYFKPVKKFFGIFLKKQGFRDGFAGFINALFLSIYDVRLYYLIRRNYK